MADLKKLDVVTTGYVYDKPGAPPLAIGSKLSLVPSEVKRLRDLRLVRLVTEEEPDYEVSGPRQDKTVKSAAPPPAPPLSTASTPAPTPAKP